MLAPGAMPMPPTWAAQGVGQVVAVEVGGGDHVVVVGRSRSCWRMLSAMASLHQQLARGGLAAAVVPTTATSANSSVASS